MYRPPPYVIQVGDDSDDDTQPMAKPVPIKQSTCVMRLPPGLFKDTTPLQAHEIHELNRMSVPARTEQEDPILFYKSESVWRPEEDMTPPEPANLKTRTPMIPPFISSSLREIFNKGGYTQYQREEHAQFFEELWDESRCRINSTRGLDYPTDAT